MGMQSMDNKENEEVIKNRLKYFTNGSLYTLVHLVHFSCTISVIPLYNDAIYPSQVMCQCTYVNHIFNGLAGKKKVDELGLNFFSQTSLLGKVSEFLCES